MPQKKQVPFWVQALRSYEPRPAIEAPAPGTPQAYTQVAEYFRGQTPGMPPKSYVTEGVPLMTPEQQALWDARVQQGIETMRQRKLDQAAGKVNEWGEPIVQEKPKRAPAWLKMPTKAPEPFDPTGYQKY